LEKIYPVKGRLVLGSILGAPNPGGVIKKGGCDWIKRVALREKPGVRNTVEGALSKIW